MFCIKTNSRHSIKPGWSTPLPRSSRLLSFSSLLLVRHKLEAWFVRQEKYGLRGGWSSYFISLNCFQSFAPKYIPAFWCKLGNHLDVLMKCLSPASCQFLCSFDRFGLLRFWIVPGQLTVYPFIFTFSRSITNAFRKRTDSKLFFFWI